MKSVRCVPNHKNEKKKMHEIKICAIGHYCRAKCHIRPNYFSLKNAPRRNLLNRNLCFR